MIKRLLKIMGVLVIGYYVLSYAFPKYIGIPLAAWQSSQVWKEHEREQNELRQADFQPLDTIKCSRTICSGTYKGPEFINGSDIAHQFSNKMAGKVGEKLKELYAKGKYSKVDFSNIIMSTKGMGSGKVIYSLSIPFISVKEKCEAYTSFDHVGGWNHKPSLSSRKAELSKALMEGQTLDISNLKTTPEGLQEYWIQWKNKIKQSDCK